MVTSIYERRRKAGDLRIGNKTFEAVQSFQYLGNIIGNTNNNNKCIKERMMMDNKAYYANRQPVNSSLISRNSKLQIYRTSVRPAFTCGSELWTHTVEGERALAVFERKMLRKTRQMKHQLDATLCRFYFWRVTVHVSGANAHHQEYLKLVQRPLLHVFCKNI